MTSKAMAELGRRPNAAYKKRYRPKHKADGTFKKSKLGKYNARGVNLDGRFFHSESEANRYMQLKVMETAKKIGRIECQVPYQIHIDGNLICTYVADFRYLILDQWGGAKAMIIEDVKGQRTTDYVLKKKLVQAKHKIEIVELPASWMKHYEGLDGQEVKPVIAELERAKKQRAAERREKRRLATKAGQMEAQAQEG